MSRTFVVLPAVLLLCGVPVLRAQTPVPTQDNDVYIPRAAVRPATPPNFIDEPPFDDDLELCAPPTWTSVSAVSVDAMPPIQIHLKVPAGTPLRIALDHRTRIAHIGEPVYGQLTQAVYAFDQTVIPAGTLATGRVTAIKKVPALRRTMSYGNGNFSPFRTYEITFDSLALPDGRNLAIRTTVSPGAAQIVRLVSHSTAASEHEKHENAIVKAAEAAKEQVQSSVHTAISEVSSPGRMDRLKQAIAAQLPYRRQFLSPGTHFNASLDAPLDFGVTTRTLAQLSALGNVPDSGSLLHASLVSKLTSETATRGTPVDAILTEPLFSASHQLVLPAYSHLFGEVVSAKPAAMLHHNGDLRVIFQRIETPEGTAQLMQGSLEAVEVDRAAGLRLDEEGGAHATDSKSRYLSTGLAIALAAAASHTDSEHGTTDPTGDPSVRAGAGTSGFGFAGGLISLAAKSTPVSIAFAAYGASESIYANFISRGHEVVFPKDTPMEIGLGNPRSLPVPAKP
jgi:hypothetical protein